MKTQAAVLTKRQVGLMSKVGQLPYIQSKVVDVVVAFTSIQALEFLDERKTFLAGDEKSVDGILVDDHRTFFTFFQAVYVPYSDVVVPLANDGNKVGCRSALDED
jgi:hypothetical protein